MPNRPNREVQCEGLLQALPPEMEPICDSRGEVKDKIFVCIKGDRHDGHTDAAGVLRRGAAAISTGACCRSRMRRGSRTGPLLRMRHRRLFEEIRLALQRSRAGGRSLRRPLFRRAVQRALGVDAARSLTHS